MSLWSICTFKWLQKVTWSLLKWLDITRIYIEKGHLTACTARSGDQTHWLNLQSITVAGACRDFSSPTKENWSAVKGNMSRNILYIVTVCQLDDQSISSIFLFVHSFWSIMIHHVLCSSLCICVHTCVFYCLWAWT